MPANSGRSSSVPAKIAEKSLSVHEESDEDYESHHSQLWESLRTVRAGHKTGRTRQGRNYGQRTDDPKDDDEDLEHRSDVGDDSLEVGDSFRDQSPHSFARSDYERSKAGQKKELGAWVKKGVRWSLPDGHKGEADDAQGRLKDEVDTVDALSEENQQWLSLLGLDPLKLDDEHEDQEEGLAAADIVKRMKRRPKQVDYDELRDWAINVKKWRNHKKDKELRTKGMEDALRAHKEKQDKARSEAALRRFKVWNTKIEKAEAKQLGQNSRFQVKIAFAQDLPCHDVMSDPSPYCVCEVPREDGRTKTKRFRTAAVIGTLTPTDRKSVV